MGEQQVFVAEAGDEALLDLAVLAVGFDQADIFAARAFGAGGLDDAQEHRGSRSPHDSSTSTLNSGVAQAESRLFLSLRNRENSATNPAFLRLSAAQTPPKCQTWVSAYGT
jgi:hypothetical protein